MAGGTLTISRPPARAHGLAVSHDFIFVFVLAIACTTSGGVILGVGAFADRIIALQLLSPDSINIVFDLGFQMLTWLSLMWSLLHDTLGPRGCGMLGLALAALGNLIIALAVHGSVHDPYVYAVAYGCIGGGGNGAYITCFQFTNLFTKNRALCVSVFAAAFNIAGYVLLVLNVDGVPLAGFFYFFCVYTACCCVGVGVVYPDSAYVEGDSPALARPSVCHGSAAAAGRCGGGGSPLRDTADTLSHAAPELCKARYWGFCFTFGWAALTQQWGAGVVGSGQLNAHDEYLKWFVPVVTNATFLLAPLIGSLIDRTGFRPVALLLVASIQLTLVLIWAGGDLATWASPVALCVLCALTYVVQFSYLTIAFPPRAYPGLLTVTLIVQGTLGFIAWPLLAVARPFGCSQCTPNYLLLLLPSLLLYAWPALLPGSSRKRTTEVLALGSIAEPASPAAPAVIA